MPEISRGGVTGGFSVQPQQLAAAGAQLREVFDQFASLEPAELTTRADGVGDRRLARALERCARAWQQSMSTLRSEGEWLHRQLSDTASLAADTDASIAEHLRAASPTASER